MIKRNDGISKDDTVTGLAFTTVDRVLDYIKKNSF